MISYDLAKQLKDAGFPQDIKRGYEGSAKFPVGTPLKTIRGSEHAYFPTLEELIEACPIEKEFFRKAFFSLQYHTGRWHAGYVNYDYDSNELDVQGSTPTEAVARLWLALNLKAV